jgi:murein L,D-transpeptidase YcbB/YkuD
VARRGAKAVASHLARTGRSGYDRRLLRQWQTQAGLTGDGIYGGATRGALIFYGVKDPPRAFFKPVDTIPFSPPE